MLHPRHLLLAAALYIYGVATAAAVEHQWPGYTIPATKIEERGAIAIVEDDEADSTRDVDGADQHVVLEQRVSRRAIAKQPIAIARTPIVPWSELEPGLYRVSARIKFEGDTGLIGTPIELAVQPQNRRAHSILYHPSDFTESGAWYQLEMLYEVDPTLSKRLQPRPVLNPIRVTSWYHDAYPEAPRPEHKPPATSEGLQLLLALPQTKYSSATGEPPNSLRWLRLDWMRMEKIQPSPSLTLRHIRPQKLWLRPGEPQAFDIALENFTDTPHTRDLLIELETDLTTRVTLHRQPITLQPGEHRTLTIPWQDTDTTRWGHAVHASIRDGDTTDHQAHDYFSIHPRVYDVHVMGSRSRAYDPFRANEPYQNLIEAFGATPGDSAGIMPADGDTWISGMSSGGLPQTFRLVKHATDQNRRHGIATHMYLYAGGTGTAFMDLYIDHPEWVASRPVATDAIYRLRQAREEAVRNHDFTQSFIDPANTPVPHIETHLNHWFPGLQQQLEEQAIEFVRRTGYIGIRFDVGIFSPKTTHTVLGTPLPYDMANAHQHAANNFLAFRDRLQEHFPGFEFGANMDSWGYLEQVGNRHITPKPPEEYPEFVAFAQSHGMFMDEGTMNAPLHDHYMNRWEDTIWGIAQKRDMAGRFGGIYQTFSPHRDSNGHFAHDDIYFAIANIAAGSHYYGNFAPPPYTRDSIGAFITRYSQYFWSTNRRLLPDAYDHIFVDAPAEVWYADTAAYEDLGTTRRYIIPLINPPVVERLRRNKTNELPPPITDPFTIEVTIPEGYTQATAHMLTWEPKIAAIPLQTTIDGDLLTVTFPALHLFRTLLIDFTP